MSSKAAIPECLATQLTRTCLPLSIMVGSLAISIPLGTLLQTTEATGPSNKPDPDHKICPPTIKNKELWRMQFIPSNVQTGVAININSFLQHWVKTQKCELKKKTKYLSTSFSG